MTDRPKHQEHVIFFAFIIFLSIFVGVSITTLPLNIPFITAGCLFLFFIGFFNTNFAFVLLIMGMLLSPEFSIAKLPGRDVVIRLEDFLVCVFFLAWLARIAILKKQKIDPKKTTIAVQGFGNVGSVAAELLRKKGCRICAISDVSTGLYNIDGLDISDILSYLNTGTRSPLLKDYNKGKNDEFISNKELLELDVDILIPSALENQIHIENADTIKAEIIVEGANGPVSKKSKSLNCR